MQEFFPKRRPKENVQNSFRIGAHVPMWPYENHLWEEPDSL